MRKAFFHGPWDTTESMWALQEGSQLESLWWYVVVLFGGLYVMFLFTVIVLQLVSWQKSQIMQTRLGSLFVLLLGLIGSVRFGEPCILFFAVLLANYLWKLGATKNVNALELNLGINEHVEMKHGVDERAEKIEKMRNWLKQLQNGLFGKEQ